MPNKTKELEMTLRQYWADHPEAFDCHPDDGAIGGEVFLDDAIIMVQERGVGRGYVLPCGYWVFPGDTFVTEIRDEV